MRNLVRLGIVLALTLPVLVFGQSAALADNNGSVTISDAGFDPPIATINVGGTITWTNTGTKVHTASSITGPVPFNTGGLGNGQAFPINFTVPGTYRYTSATDCVNSGGGQGPGFDCGTVASVVVVDVNKAYNPNAFPTPSPTNTPLPTTGPPQSVAVQITAHGFVPPTVTIALGGSVTWINADNGGTHTATTTSGGNPTPFDTGGLGPGLSSSFGFTLQGTYTYTSAIDCLNGSSTPGFSCGVYQIIVSGQQSALAPPPAAGASGSTSSVAVAGTSVTIDDVDGYTPPVLAIHPGQTVTWTNSGKQVHAVVSNPGYPNQFDSGGLNPGQKFSFTFALPGSYGYHSSTEAAYGIDGMGNKVPQFKFNGTVVAQ
jgi:plastocyanin